MGYKHDGHEIEASATKTSHGWKPGLSIDGVNYSFAETGPFHLKCFHEKEEALIYADAYAEWIIHKRD